MKRIYFIFLLASVCCFVNAQTYTICLGANATLSAVNSGSLTNPQYSLNPGGLFSSNGVFVVSPAGTSIYTVYVTGANSNSQTVTTSTTQTVYVNAPHSFSVSSPNNFTLGCLTKSVITASMGITSGTTNAVFSYSFFPPGSNITTSTATLNTSPIGTITAPGGWTLVAIEHTGSCIVKAVVSVLANTTSPSLSTSYSTNILTCRTPSIVLSGQSASPNVSYQWSFIALPGSVNSASINVNTATVVPTQTLINNYTLTIKDNNNFCSSSTVIPIYQNIFPPIAKIAPSSPTLTCSTPSVVLINMSTTTIPPFFSPMMPVVGHIWTPPAPLPTLTFATTYTAPVAGLYSLTVMDLNNGCITTTMVTVSQDGNFPVVQPQQQPYIICGNESAYLSPTIITPSSNLIYTWTAPTGAVTQGGANAQLITKSPGIFTLQVANQQGCISTTFYSVVLCTGLKNFTQNDFIFYPNPVENKLTLQIGSNYESIQIDITDITGKIYYSIFLNQSVTDLDMSELPGGVYVLSLSRDGRVLQRAKFSK